MCVCVSITCWQHTPITHFMFVSFHDAIRILAYPWLCTNSCVLCFSFVWFCSTNVCSVALYGCLPFLSCAYRIGATLCLCFVFLILRLHSEHCLCFSFMCCCSRFIATPSLFFSAILRALPLRFFTSSSPLLYLSVLFLCFDDVNRCASS